jgi:acetyl coenzyme A synthetase (ADP forming)-like protein
MPAAQKKNIKQIFFPESVAIVGATRTKGTVPYDIFENIIEGGFQGVVYPVSPGAHSIRGVKTYKYVLDIPDPVDLAVLVFPSSVCELAMEQIGQKGIKACIVISAGFREVGPAGTQRQAKLQAITEKYGISVCGPNCLGAINTDPSVRLNASFARKMPDQGSIAFLSQSGALCTAVLDYARGKHIGFSKFVSFGNKMDISEVDLIYYLADDPDTKVILVYLEEIRDGQALLRAAQEVIRRSGKPILAIKSGRTQAGASAAASHTGSLAGSDEVCDAIFRQAGIERCKTIEDMFNKAIALAYQPRPKTPKVAIITNAGGPGVMAADAVSDCGMELAKFSPQTTEVFKRSLPVTANIKNPVDVIGDARSDRYQTALTAALADPDVAGAMVILTPQSMTDIEDIAHTIVKTRSASSEKPVYTSFMGETDVAVGADILLRARIPHYILPESMATAFATSYRFEKMLEVVRKPVPVFKDVDPARAQKLLKAAEGKHHLPEVEATELLAAYGLPVLPFRVAKTAAEAARAAGEIGYPVALKIYSADIVHKMDVGGVKLNLQTAGAVKDAFETMLASVKKAQPEAKILGVNVQKMAPAGRETIIGLKRDAAFGPVIMFGLGGTFVEIFRDVSFRAAPLDSHDITTMVREIRSFPILAGARGGKKCDVAKLEECILRLAQLALDCPQIAELDMNPVIVGEEGQGAFVADARVML